MKNMQTHTTVFIISSLEKRWVPRKPIRERILFIENKISQLKNNEIMIKDYVNILANKYRPYLINMIMTYDIMFS